MTSLKIRLGSSLCSLGESCWIGVLIERPVLGCREEVSYVTDYFVLLMCASSKQPVVMVCVTPVTPAVFISVKSA